MSNGILLEKLDGDQRAWTSKVSKFYSDKRICLLLGRYDQYFTQYIELVKVAKSHLRHLGCDVVGAFMAMIGKTDVISNNEDGFDLKYVKQNVGES